MTDERTLYIWLKRDIKEPPEIHVKAATEMPLMKFRDKYVDTSKSYVVVRVYHAKDDQGRPFNIVLEPAEEIISAENAGNQRLTGTSLTTIKGVGRKIAALFQKTTEVDSIEALVRAGATSKGRADLAAATGKPKYLILRWVQLSDLMRVDGVGEDYSALLWRAGVTSAPELAQQNPDGLLKILENSNRRLNVVNRLPAADRVKSWIEQAQKLPAIVE